MICFRYATVRFVLFILLCCSQTPVLSEPSNNDLRDLLLIGNVEAVIATVESDRAINWSKNKLKINPIASQYYAIALIVYGDIDKANLFLNAARVFYPKSQELRDCKKHLDFFANYFINQDLKFTKEEKIHIKLYDLLHLYLAEQAGSKQAEKFKKKILKETNTVVKTLPYFMTRLDYLAELQDPVVDKSIEADAFRLIQDKRKVLFPKPMDFYELASAYKNLARLSIKASDLQAAKQYIKLAQNYIFKMKALWLEEDIRYYRPIMKIEERSTKFGYVLPQWLILLREEYENYLQ